MATAETIDLASLLAPAAGDSPAGVNLRAEKEGTSLFERYQAVRGAERDARTAEREVFEKKNLSADPAKHWTAVLEGSQALLQASKDFEVAGWLLEALVRRSSFAGLRDGLRLLRALAETFWDGLHPPPGEEGVADRIRILGQLNGLEGREGALIRPLRRLPLTETGDDRGPFHRIRYLEVEALEAISDPEKRQKRIDGGALTRDRLDRAEEETSLEFAQALKEDLEAARAELAELRRVLDEKAGDDPSGSPAGQVHAPTDQIEGVLQESLQVVEGILARKAPAGAPEGEGERSGEMETGETPGGGGQRLGGGKVGDREAAFRALLEVAQFFKRTEPHSPLSFVLERAVRWGKLPLPELYAELIPNEDVRKGVFQLIGIEPPPSAG